MKIKWIEADKFKPTDYCDVLAHFKNGDTLIVYFDGDDWYDSSQGNVLPEPLYWMHIPLLPGE